MDCGFIAQGGVGGPFVSIVRVGLSETKHFAEGYEAIFGKKKQAAAKKPKAKAAAKTSRTKNKAVKKKK
jgi:hypothetical protein